jgi:cysteine desulfuration protein SufE
MSYEGIPEKLSDMLDMFSGMDRSERIQMLIDIGSGFKDVPSNIASRPFDESRRVPNCESEAFVFAEPNDDGTLKYHFAVENPQGISAKATAVILDKTLSGAPLEQVLKVPADVVYDIFGRELSMGKNMGLTGMVNFCKVFAAQQLSKAKQATP